MKLTLHGVRGSIASPHSSMTKYGGNTSCLLLESEQGGIVVFDAGTGIRKLGNLLSSNGYLEKDIPILFSHFHWDHIQGFPFFRPVYQTGRKIHLISDVYNNKANHPVLEQFSQPYFPMEISELRAIISHSIIKEGETLIIEDMKITVKPLNHKGGGFAYRVDTSQGSLAYITDNELFPPPEQIITTPYQEWVSFLQGVNLLIHDAMYLDDELEKIHGWGHSLVSQALQLAYDAKVTAIVLFHHDPNRTDEQLDKIQQNATEWMKQQKPLLKCQVFVAKEGDCYQISSNKVKLVKEALIKS